LEIVFRSDVDVQLVKHSASDQDIAFAARVSTIGDRTIGYEDNDDNKKLTGLIEYLMRDRHGSPFEHSTFTFYVKAPIFVWREHMRHRMASYNEESGRYRVLQPEFYVPGGERKLLQIGKPGAYTFEDGTTEQRAITSLSFKRSCKEAYQTYDDMIRAGVAREVARGVLPVTIYSSAYVTMNSRALMNFLSLRQNVEGQRFPSFPQREIEMVAEKYESVFQELMPITYAAFVRNGRVAP
jgi:thymidylate synthase (FAD)